MEGWDEVSLLHSKEIGNICTQALYTGMDCSNFTMFIFLCTLSKHVSSCRSWAGPISVKIMRLEKLCPKVFLLHLEKKAKQNKQNCRWLWDSHEATLSKQCPGGGVLPYMSYIGMCRCEGYGFTEVYSRIGYRNQRVLVSNRISFSAKLINCLKNLVWESFPVNDI